MNLPAGHLVVSNWNTNPDSIYGVDPATGDVLATLVLAANLDPVSMAVDGNQLFVLDNNPDRIVEINPTNGQEIASVDVSSFLNFGGNNAGGLRVHPTTGNFWLASSSDGRVAEITPAGALVGTSISLANVGSPTGLDFDNSDNILVSNTWGMINRYPLTPPPTPDDPVLVSIAATALGGTPANGGIASANAGQTIRLNGTDFTDSTRIIFAIRNNSGGTGTTTLAPTAVSDDGTWLEVIVPDLAETGDVTLAGSGSGTVPLQIVPIITSMSGRPGVDANFTLFGSGFMERASTITVGGIVIDDVTRTSPFDDVTGTRNSSYAIRLPFAVEGPVRVETAGGFDEIAGPSFALPNFVEFDQLLATASAGLPANSGTPSANTGQTITLVGRGFTSSTLVQFDGSDDAGADGLLTRTGTPSSGGTRLTVTVPALAKTGEVRVLGDRNSTVAQLQIVPILRAVGGDVTSGNTVLLEGTGLVENDLTLSIDGQNVATPDVETIFDRSRDQQVIVLTVPGGVSDGEINVTTSGGSYTLATAITLNALADVVTGETAGGAGDITGNTLGTALAVNLPSRSSVTIDPFINTALDVDLYQFSFNAGDLLQIDVQGTGAGTGNLGDSYLRVFDSAGNALAADDSSGPSSDSRLKFRVPTDGTYYLGVSGDANRTYDPNVSGSGTNGATGSYQLVVQRGREGDSRLSSITSALGSGTARQATVAAANIGQTITLTGTGLRGDDQVVFTRNNSAGNMTTMVVNPTSVASDGTSLDVVVPREAVSGIVRIARDNGGIFLQVVPTLVDIDQGVNDIYHEGGLRIRGTAFVEGATTIQFGGQSFTDISTDGTALNVFAGYVHENDALDVTVPNEADFGPIVVSTLGGSSEAFGLTFDGIINVAGSGTPADPGEASANPGENITLTGSGFDNSTDIVFVTSNSAGTRRERIVRPTAVAPDGTSLEVTVPVDAVTAEIGIVGDQNNTRALLQIVPTLSNVNFTSYNGSSTSSVQLRGTGFIEGDGVYTFGTTNLVDPDTGGGNRQRLCRLRPRE